MLKWFRGIFISGIVIASCYSTDIKALCISNSVVSFYWIIGIIGGIYPLLRERKDHDEDAISTKNSTDI